MQDASLRRLRALVARPGVLWKLRRLRALEAFTGVPIVYGNSVTIFDAGKAYFEAVERAISQARRGVAVEMYTWADDRLGLRLARLLADRARGGLAVLVLLDAVGSFGTREVERILRESGGEVIWYHPLTAWGPSWFPNRRNHRKTIVVDGRLAFVGGRNVAESFSEEFAGADAWRDLGLSVEGPGAREVLRLFLESWGRAGGDLERAAVLLTTARETGSAGMQVIGGRGIVGRRRLRRSLHASLAQADERILVANAYFVPEISLQRRLVAAARRGVRVDLLLPKVTDVPLVRWASRATFGRLLRAGVRIREHARAVLHAKAAIVDGEVLVTGSANLDYRSFRHNLEIAVKVFDGESARAASEGLERDFEAGEEVTLEAWKRRGLAARLQERFATLLRYWL